MVNRKLELSRAERHVHNFMMDTQLTKRVGSKLVQDVDALLWSKILFCIIIAVLKNSTVATRELHYLLFLTDLCFKNYSALKSNIYQYNDIPAILNAAAVPFKMSPILSSCI